MGEPGTLEALELLQKDLIALSESRLHYVERLWAQLENHIDEFKKLLDKPPRNNASREKLSKGKVELRDEEYEVNQEFQQGALQLADALELDEIVAAQIFLDAEDDAILLGRSQLESAVIRFHRRRICLLDCFRILLEQSLGSGSGTGSDTGTDVSEREQLQQLIGVVLNAPQGSSQFIRKCLSAMANCKTWLQNLTDKVNSASVLGQSQTQEFSEIIQYERLSLVRQHELLGVTICHMIKANHSSLTDLEYVLCIIKKVDKYDNLLVHYFPALGALIQVWIHSAGSPLTLDQIQPLHDKYFASKDDQSWPLHYVHAAVSTLWLSEYIAWYEESSADPLLANVNIGNVRNALSERFMETIRYGAFDFFMSMCAEVKPVSWRDPAQHEISDWIDHKGGTLALPWQRIEHTIRSTSSDQDIRSNPIKFSQDFENVFMEQMEMFVDAFACNAPNVLRKLRHDSDERRQLGQTHDPEMHIEKFLVIISFAFEGRHNAALQAFWSDPDSHMHGFLVWASQRSSTPLTAAFNGMLRSITGDPECANAAHNFFVDEPSSSSGKGKKAQMSWEFIMDELKYFSNKLNEDPAITNINVYRNGKPRGDQDETDVLAAESLLVVLMLQTYLHLLTRMCTQSADARNYLLKSSTFDVLDQMFELLSIPSPQVTSMLRGCTFNALEALCISKTIEASYNMWDAVEWWRSGSYFTPENLPKVSTRGSTFKTIMDDIFVLLETGFEQTNAFVRFLNILVLPVELGGLNDELPFPENPASSSTRVPGIFDYVDFVMKVFKNKTCDKVASKKSLEEINEMRVLRWSCLDFVSTCLTTFNEDLLIFADQSHIQVDNTIRTSNLDNYVKLHPFGRVMEWLFNDSVMEALFAAVDQDVVEVGNAEADSPLVLSLMGAIMMMNRVLDVQQTYLNRVRPAIKNEPILRLIPVSNAAYTSFEDGILKHLSIIASLGGYCTTGHPDLTVASLKLLQKLSTSPKLISPTGMIPDRRLERNKAVVALEIHEDTESISKALAAGLNIGDEVDDVDSPSNLIKASILEFLNASIACSPNRPTVAHLLLGFQCGADALDVPENGLLAQQTSLVHKVMLLALDLPTGKFQNHVSSWLIKIKCSCLQLLGGLWTSPLSSGFSTGQLRANDFLTHLVLRELIIRADTMWDGRLITDFEFMFESSATALTAFLVRRSSIYKFLAIELRLLATEHAPTWKQRIISTLLGSSKGPNGEHLAHASVFDFFDFMELELEEYPARPELHYLSNIDLRLCHEICATGESFDLRKVQELVVLRGRELQNAGQITSPDTDAHLIAERELLLYYLQKINHLEAIRVARSGALQAWVQLMCMIIESEGLGEDKTAFVLQSMQRILPKLEKYSAENMSEATELARLAKALLFSLDLSSQNLDLGQKLATESAGFGGLLRGDIAHPNAAERQNLTELANERLFSLFRIAIRAVQTPSASAPFKQLLYSICYRYLTGIFRSNSIRAISQRKQCMKIIRLAGDRLTEILCDDAYASEQECRISALILLSALVTLSRQGDPEESKHVIESFARFNFIGILVDGLQSMPIELRDTSDQDAASQIIYCKAKLSLLLQIAQTRLGAAHILNARLFRSVKDSGLFSMDPDLGMDLAVSNQEKVYYELLLGIVRVINACIVSRGAQNEQTLQEGRKFVLENRTSMMTVMKKHAGIGGVDDALELDVGDLAEAFMLLISLTDFLRAEEIVEQRIKSFT